MHRKKYHISKTTAIDEEERFPNSATFISLTPSLRSIGFAEIGASGAQKNEFEFDFLDAYEYSTHDNYKFLLI